MKPKYRKVNGVHTFGWWGFRIGFCSYRNHTTTEPAWSWFISIDPTHSDENAMQIQFMFFGLMAGFRKVRN